MTNPTEQPSTQTSQQTLVDAPKAGNTAAPSAETPVKVFMRETKKVIEEIKKLPKDRRFQVYTGLFLIMSVSFFPSFFNFLLGRSAYVLFGIFVPAAVGALMVLSAYTGKNIVAEMEKNKQRTKPQAHSVTMHEEDEIHETHTLDS